VSPALGRTLVVGVGELGLSASPEDRLVTYALGSCLGVSAHDPRAGVGGLLHFMLPASSLNPEKARERPAMFGDTGLPLFLGMLFEQGATRRDLVVKIAGAAGLEGGDRFGIGGRNLLLARRLLWKNGLAPTAEAVGGKGGLTLSLDIGSGETWIKDGRGKWRL
jgi:chemotaxis protein CheD